MWCIFEVHFCKKGSYTGLKETILCKHIQVRFVQVWRTDIKYTHGKCLKVWKQSVPYIHGCKVCTIMQTLCAVNIWKACKTSRHCPKCTPGSKKCKAMQCAVYRSGRRVCKDMRYYTHVEVKYVKVCRHCTLYTLGHYVKETLCTVHTWK